MRQSLSINVDQDKFSISKVRDFFSTVSSIRVVDSLILFITSQLALLARFDNRGEPSHYIGYAVLLGLLLAANIFMTFGLYNRRTIFAARTILRIGPAWGLSILVLIAVGFGTQTAGDVSRIWVTLWFGFGLAGLIAWRCAVAWINGWSTEAAGPSRRIAVLGNCAAAKNVGERLVADRTRTCRLVGLFGDEASADGIPWLRRGDVDDLVAYCRADLLDEVVIAADGSDPGRTGQWLDTVRQLPVSVSVVPAIADRYVPLRGIRRLGQLDVISVAEPPLVGGSRFAKRLEDVVVSLFVIIVMAPLMLLLAIAIKLDSRGPVFFRQTRYGFNDELIEVLKFRTMGVSDSPSPASELRQATRDDPRVTRVGRWLRRSSLDELPQFWHVLTGKMSVVGPRPHAVYHHHKYIRLIDGYSSRHRVKPGITGWAQINGLRGETTTVDMMKKRVEYDLFYVENWTLELDFMILLRTVLTGMWSKNAY